MPAHIIQRKEKRYEKQTNIRGSPETIIGLIILRISLSRERLVAKAYMEVSDRVRNGSASVRVSLLSMYLQQAAQERARK